MKEEKDQQNIRSDEPIFFTGQSMKDINLPSGKSDLQPAANEPAETELAEGDTSEKTEPVVKPSPSERTAPVGLEEKAEPEDEPEDEYARIINKYGGDPHKMAQAIKAYQRTANEKAREARRYQQLMLSQHQYAPQQQYVAPQAAPQKGTPAVDTDDIDITDAELDEIWNELSDGEKARDGLKKLFKKSSEQGRRAYEKARERDFQAQREREAREIEQANIAVLYGRAKEILRDRAEAEGNTEAYELYSNPKYQATEQDYLDAYDDIEREFNYIVQNIAPRDGRLKPEHFDYARTQLDPVGYAKKLTAQTRAKTLQDVRNGSPTRRVLTPQAGGHGAHRARRRLDVKSLPDDRDRVFDMLWRGQVSEEDVEDLESQLLAGKK